MDDPQVSLSILSNICMIIIDISSMIVIDGIIIS